MNWIDLAIRLALPTVLALAAYEVRQQWKEDRQESRTD